MSVEIAWKQNILVTDFHLLKSLLVVLGFGSQAFVCGFSRQNINSVVMISAHVYGSSQLAATTSYVYTDRNFVDKCSQQVMHFDHEATY